MSGILGLLGNIPGIINGSLPSGGNPTSSSWDLLNTGALQTGDNVGGALGDTWVDPASAGVAALYQAKVDVTAGAFTAGDATGSWLDLSTSRFWTRIGVGTVTFTVTFREKGTTRVRSTQTGITLTVS